MHSNMIQNRLLTLPHGITLSCRMAGDEDRPVLMFLHGFPEAAFVWDVLLAHFARPENGGYRCIAPNLRGFEQSSAPPEPAAYRAKHLVQDISALIALVCSGEDARNDERAGQQFSDGPPQGKLAPSGGRELHAVSERGGDEPAAGPPQGGLHPLGGQRPTRSEERGGDEPAAGPPQGGLHPLGGQHSTRSDMRGGQLACLIAHDWGGAVAWNLAATMPQLMKKLAIINSPHPGTFLRELQHSPAQQAASAYMNFLIRPDAEALLAQDDFRRLWQFLTTTGDRQAPGVTPAWLTERVKDQYRAVWRAGLTGGCNLYRASPLRPPRPGPPHHDPAAAAVTLPREMLTVLLPTLVLWALDDIALPPALLDGLEDYVPQMQLRRVGGASHWIVHEQPEQVAGFIQSFLDQAGPTQSL